MSEFSWVVKGNTRRNQGKEATIKATEGKDSLLTAGKVEWEEVVQDMAFVFHGRKHFMAWFFLRSDSNGKESHSHEDPQTTLWDLRWTFSSLVEYFSVMQRKIGPQYSRTLRIRLLCIMQYMSSLGLAILLSWRRTYKRRAALLQRLSISVSHFKRNSYTMPRTLSSFVIGAIIERFVTY